MAQHFTDQDFEKEVLQYKGLVVVDMYADWCVSPDAMIATSRGLKRAGAITKEDKVTAYSGRKQIISEVAYSVTSKLFGHCVSIETEAGRNIKATDDHRLSTQKGWKRADGLKAGDKLVALPFSDEIFSMETRRKGVILSRQNIVKIAGKKMRTEQYIEELERKNLLPLRFNHKNLPLIVRLMGALFSDGTLYQSERTNYREISFVVGQAQDMKDVERDLRELGFPLVHKKERVTKNELSGRIWYAHSFRLKSLSTSLWLFFKALGVPEGRKTDIPYRIPYWIFKASPFVQQQFLAGYLGGDGPKVTIRTCQRKRKNPYNLIHINDLEFYKREDLKKAGLSFANDLKRLLERFGVHVLKIFTEKAPYFRKDGKRSSIIHIDFQSNVESAYALAGIGYAYAHQKQLAASHAGEFLRRIKVRRARWTTLWFKAKKLSSKFSINEIAQKLHISESAVFGWLKKGNKPTTPKYYELFTNWIIKATKGLGDGFVWDVIKEIKPIYLPAVQKITVDKAHNFISNGLLSHNCGPCKMMGPLIEELAKHYEGKVKIGKLDVDANGNTASKFGIASIPTTIFFKDGKEVDRMIGFQSKESLEKKIKEHQ